MGQLRRKLVENPYRGGLWVVLAVLVVAFVVVAFLRA
jgi:hypothetical protein